MVWYRLRNEAIYVDPRVRVLAASVSWRRWWDDPIKCLGMASRRYPCHSRRTVYAKCHKTRRLSSMAMSITAFRFHYLQLDIWIHQLARFVGRSPHQDAQSQQCQQWNILALPYFEDKSTTSGNWVPALRPFRIPAPILHTTRHSLGHWAWLPAWYISSLELADSMYEHNSSSGI